VKTYISMLRAINVLGKRMIKMPELAKLYEDLGFHDVQTYIQSGNVIFKADDGISSEILSANIEQAILEKFGFNVPVILRTPEEIASCIQHNPFHNTDGSPKDNIYVTFLESEPSEGLSEAIRRQAYFPDRFFIIRREIYIDCAGGYGTTKLSNTFFEKKLRVRATTRNWKTVNTLYEIAG
jgi:uncharacterized protein (DUF1697 family)